MVRFDAPSPHGSTGPVNTAHLPRGSVGGPGNAVRTRFALERVRAMRGPPKDKGPPKETKIWTGGLGSISEVQVIRYFIMAYI